MNALLTEINLPKGPLELPGSADPSRPLWQLLESVTDPEIPVLSLREIGVLRAICPGPLGWKVFITPTYSGCPALLTMQEDISRCLAEVGFQAEVFTCLSPAWSSDWLTDSGKEKLRAYGISPPHKVSAIGEEQVIHWVSAKPRTSVACPQCGSTDTTQTSYFGSTACKALYTCRSCLEPFDYFKPY